MSLRRFLSVLLISVVALCAPSQTSAQNLSTSKQDSGEPNAEAFSGYSGYRAGGSVTKGGVKVPDFTFGWASQFIYKMSPGVGIVGDVNGHYNNFASAFDLAFGPRFFFPWKRFVPFVEGLTGVQRFSPKGLPGQNAATYIVGAGLDVKVNSGLSVRPFQISYVNTYYSPSVPTPQRNYFNGVRVQAGLVYDLRWHSRKSEAIAFCSAEPTAVNPGVAVKVGVIARGFPHRQTLHYSYATTGGVIAGSSATESVDTTGAESGTYLVSAKVTVDGEGKHQPTASCEAQFSVNAKAPKSVVAAEQAKKPEQAKNTAAAETKKPQIAVAEAKTPAVSAQQSQNSPVVATEEAKPPVPKEKAQSPAVAATVPTSKPQSSYATPAGKSGKVEAATLSKFGSIEFVRDLKRPTRVDNEAKAELDRYAEALTAMPDANGVVVGHAGIPERKDSKKGLSIASQRAVNAKCYVSKDRGVDPARIQPRIGSFKGRKADLWIVPAGVEFAAKGTKVVDERKVKAAPRVPVAPKGTKRYAKKRQSPAKIHPAISPQTHSRGPLSAEQ